MEGDLTEKQIGLNLTSADEHVGDAERLVRTIKERVRGVYCTLPYNKLPGRIIIELAYYVVFWLDTFCPSQSVADNLSPRELITGKSVDFNIHCKYEFGEYAQTHESTDNTMNERTVGALALRPTGNAQGGHFFLSLTTGRRLNRLHATKLPMPNEVITRVETMARNDPVGLDFRDRNNQPILDSINYSDDDISITSEGYDDERPHMTNRNDELDDSSYESNESVNTDSTTPVQIAGVNENTETPPINNNTDETSEPPTDDRW